MIVHPSASLSRYFTVRELFPLRLIESRDSVPAAELYLARMTCLSVLDMLRRVWDQPLMVNVGEWQNRGWRDAQGVQQAKSVTGSDHTLLALNPWAHGACDLHARKPEDTTGLFMLFAQMQEGGAWSYPCREIIYERHGTAQWIHVSWPGEFKAEPFFRSTFSLELSRTRPPRSVEGVGAWRYYRIIDGAPREAVTASLEAL